MTRANPYAPKDIIEEHIKLELLRLKQENTLLKNWILSGKVNPVCVVCGKPIESASLQRLARPHLWHNRECFQDKPRKIIALEHKYQLDIVDILKETTKHYGNIKAQCGALGVSIPYFYQIIKKYCKQNRVEFMAEHAIGKRKELYLKKIGKMKLSAAFK